MKPVCECGSELLLLYQVRYVETIRRIGKDGRAFKKAKDTIDCGGVSEGLHCPSCQNIYECDMKPDGRIFRGDLIGLS